MKKWILTTGIGNLEERKEELTILAEKLFKEIVSLPKEVRNDEKERNGMAIFIASRFSDNFIRFNIGTPSDRAIRYAQRKAEMLEFSDIFTTREHENPEYAIWAGGICTSGSVYEEKNETNPEGIWLCIGVSGLKSEEDEVIAIILAATILEVSPKEMAEKMVPGELSENIRLKGHYLYEIIEKYS